MKNKEQLKKQSKAKREFIMKKSQFYFLAFYFMLSLNTNIYASESMDSNEYSIIETFQMVVISNLF